MLSFKNRHVFYLDKQQVFADFNVNIFCLLIVCLLLHHPFYISNCSRLVADSSFFKFACSEMIIIFFSSPKSVEVLLPKQRGRGCCEFRLLAILHRCSHFKPYKVPVMFPFT